MHNLRSFPGTQSKFYTGFESCQNSSSKTTSYMYINTGCQLFKVVTSCILRRSLHFLLTANCKPSTLAFGAISIYYFFLWSWHEKSAGNVEEPLSHLNGFCTAYDLCEIVMILYNRMRNYNLSLGIALQQVVFSCCCGNNQSLVMLQTSRKSVHKRWEEIIRLW